MINAIIIDDEEKARDSLRALLSAYCPEVNILDSCSNLREGVLSINRNMPQLVFLDIEMPEYNGFRLLDFFNEVNFEIIFVTAYNEYALQAFEVSAVDYLLKPVDIDKLKSAVQKARLKVEHADMQNRLDALKENVAGTNFNKIALPVADGLLFVSVNDILLLEADGAYTHVWLKNATNLLVSKKLKFFEEILSERQYFFRCHRSFIVNINQLKKYNKGEGTLELESGKVIYIARDRKAEFEQQLKENKLTVGS